MNKKNQSYQVRGSVLFIGILLYIGALIYANNDGLRGNESRFSYSETATVIQVLEDNSQIDEVGHTRGSLRVNLEIKTGQFAGERIESTYFFTQLTDVHIGEGDRVSVQIALLDGEIGSVDINNPERREILVAFIAFFLLILGIIGGKRGLMAIAGLAFTLISIFFLLVPLMLKGHSVIISTFAILSVVTVVTLILLGGVTPKIISAILGCIVGVFTAAVLAYGVGNLAFISGLHMEDIDLLLATNPDFSPTQASGLFISGVLIASLGAVMDTAVSVSSAMEEIKISSPRITPGRLFRSGMNVGRDTMGTMSNTLILAFAGTSLNMMIIIYSQGVMFNQFINNEFIAIELIRSIAGSLGIILTVPAVAFIGAMIMADSKKEN